MGCVSSQAVSEKPVSSLASSRGSDPAPPSSSEPLPPPPPQLELKVFTFKEVKAATNNFKKSVGSGAFGEVYLGTVTIGDEGEGEGEEVQVAIKVLGKDSTQGFEEFLKEIFTLTSIQHEYVVRLVGYCPKPECCLVYEYVPNGTVFQMLALSKVGKKPFHWKDRVSIAYQCAVGLAFIHKKKIIHRDFKAANVLLGENNVAKISDFGLMREGPSKTAGGEGKSWVQTRVLGTLGYVDPEYLVSGCLHRKCDVYSLAVFMLELLTGQLVGTDFDIDKIRPHLANLPDGLNEIIDPRLEIEGEWPPDVEVLNFARVCYASVGPSVPEARPEAEEVANLLKDIKNENLNVPDTMVQDDDDDF